MDLDMEMDMDMDTDADMDTDPLKEHLDEMKISHGSVPLNVKNSSKFSSNLGGYHTRLHKYLWSIRPLLNKFPQGNRPLGLNSYCILYSSE